MLTLSQMRTRPGEKVLDPVWPNAGIRAAYAKKLRKLIEEMARSYLYWLKAQYRSNPPTMAQDATPARDLERELARLGVQWRKRFEDVAPQLATWFATSAAKRSDRALQDILRKGGWTVPFSMPRVVKDMLDATVAENVSLIKSIPEQYHTQVATLVMQSVKAGRDLETLTSELYKRHDITWNRAKWIALDQNNKATSAMQAARQTDLGIEEGIWLHSHAGKEPRPTHVDNDGKRFSIEKGWYDPDPKVRQRIWPGQLINCRCTWKPVVKGFS